MLMRAIKEPLAQFSVFALIIFLVYGVLNPSEAKKPNRILITGAKFEQLAAYFAMTRHRAPTESELKGLIDDYIKEEVYYREALALGLDKDDTVIRRRLRNKMEFLSQAEAEGSVPAEAELEEYLKANPRKFEIEPSIAFRHVYLSLDKHGTQIGEDAALLLAVLLKDPGIDPSTLGDGTLIPSELPITGKASIGQVFGLEFANALDKVTPGRWTGPVKSAFGLHIVRVTEYKAGRIPALGEVRDAVTREWANDKRVAIDEARFNKLLKRYDVNIESVPQPKANR